MSIQGICVNYADLLIFIICTAPPPTTVAQRLAQGIFKTIEIFLRRPTAHTSKIAWFTGDDGMAEGDDDGFIYFITSNLAPAGYSREEEKC